ncbi:MAG: hypothetical protein O3C60_19305, partial [Planctomycetota bacterium]|nr:hypothetical protein [Planctomycetota bacterium]
MSFLARRAADPCRWRKPPDGGHKITLARRATQGDALRIGDYYFKHAQLMVSCCKILQTMTSRV